MASCLNRLALVHTLLRPFGNSQRLFSASSPALVRRAKPEEKLTADQAFDLLDDSFDEDDSATAGHIMLREQRRVLYYLRLIEHEMPKLVAYRKPYIPPTPQTPLIVRSLDYAGEEHPATAKRVVVVAVSELPLRDTSAVHKLKLLAGPRWTPTPPSDAGVGKGAPYGQGFIKISCENFQNPAMNLKWASDTLNRLVIEANRKMKDFEDIPLDLRHLRSKARKAKRGDHLRGRLLQRPSILDFPRAWLQPPTSNPH